MQLNNERAIILTGAAGFIGSCILKKLNEQNITNIIVVDSLRDSNKWKNLVGKQFVDYLHKDQLFDWLSKPQKKGQVGAIIHMGACSSTVEVDVDYLMANNFQYTKRLAEFALENDIRFIYASSAATYGDGSKGFVDKEEDLEDLEPLNAYGFSKHLFDLWAKEQRVFDQITGLKFFNVFGPNEFHKKRMASVIHNLLPQVQHEKIIRLFKSNDPERFNDGEQCRDFIYVKDAADIVIQILKQDICGIYNLGSGEANTWNHVARGMFNAIGLATNIQYLEMPKDLQGKYQNFTRADMSKLKQKIENLSFTPLHHAIKDYISNHLLPQKVF